MAHLRFALPLAAAFVLAAAVPASAAPVAGFGTASLDVEQSLAVPSVGGDVQLFGRVDAVAFLFRPDPKAAGLLLYAVDFRGVHALAKGTQTTFATPDAFVRLTRVEPEDTVEVPIGRSVNFPPPPNQANGMQLFFTGKLKVSGSTRLAASLQGLFSLDE